MLGVPQPSRFLIADISGYTGYLAEVELDHAQGILADLIGAVVTALRPNLKLPHAIELEPLPNDEVLRKQVVDVPLW